ncbi:zf-HC2 domain-containing protein [Streptomyces sp. NPDC020422]|uniref:zf-HC2 domain-containing protein n=1 Tax=Streptomyces sp. NPDC020422 TaxID=3365074 RepID=UPI00378DBE26
MECARLRELAAELALGVLPARERAEAVAHLDRCPDCREHVERLTAVGDGLLGLLPEAEPPVGFESRVVAALAPAPARRPRGRRLRLAGAAVAAALAFGFGGWAVGTVVEGAPAVSTHPALVEAALVSGGHEVGQVFAHPGEPGWVYMSVDLEGAGADGGRVRCVLDRSDGGSVALGSFALEDGYGYWGAPADLGPAAPAAVRLLGADGTVLATAHFS